MLNVFLRSLQLQPGDRAGAGEAESGAREAESSRPGEDPPAAGAHVNVVVWSEGKLLLSP